MKPLVFDDWSVHYNAIPEAATSFRMCWSMCMNWMLAVRCDDSPGGLLLEWLLRKPAGMQRLHPRHSHSLCHAGHMHPHQQFASDLLDSARTYCPGPAHHTHDRSHGTSHACHITPFAIAWITNCPISWCPAQQLCFLVVVVGRLLYAALNTDPRMTRSTAERCVVVMVLQKALKRPHFCLSNRTVGFAFLSSIFL